MDTQPEIKVELHLGCAGQSFEVTNVLLPRCMGAAVLAQLVEHLRPTPDVQGSNPLIG